MNKIAEAKFVSELVLERSITPNVERLGSHESIMTLNKVEDNYYCIEWEVPALNMYVEIGVWTEDKKVVDYDGVFELCKEAIKLLNDNGFDTKEVE